MLRFFSFYRRKYMYAPDFRRFALLGMPHLLARHATLYTLSAHTTKSSARIIKNPHDSKRNAASPENLSSSSTIAIEDIVEEEASTAYLSKSSSPGISDTPYLGLDIGRDRGSFTGLDDRLRATLSTEGDNGDNEIMQFSKAKIRLAFYASLLGNRALKSFLSTVPSLSADELGEIRNILDCIIQSDHPQKNHCILDSFRVAYHFGFPKRCCELYASVVRDAFRGGGKGENRPPIPEAVLMSEVVLEAAAATMDLETLSLCTGVVEQMASIDCASVRKPLEVAASAVVPPLRLYWCLVLLLRDHQFAPKHNTSVVSTEEGEMGDLSITTKVGPAQRFHTPLTALSTRVAAVLGVVEENRAEFLVASVRLAFYNKDAVEGQAAVYHHVFRHWCSRTTDAQREQPPTDHNGSISNKARNSLPLWLTPHCLHELIRSAAYARRHDMAEVYSLYVDLFWRRRARLHSAEHDTSVLLNTAETLDYYEDALIGSMVRYFVFSRQTRRAVLWMQRLTSQFPRYVPSISVCNTIARLAAAERNISLSRWCLGHLLSEKQPVPPTSVELYSCLCANARAGIPNFDQVLHSLQENQLVQLTEEELLHLRLLYCRGSTQWQDISKIVLQATSSAVSFNGGDGGADLALGSTGVSTVDDDCRSFGIDSMLDGRTEYLETNPRSVFSIRNLDQLLLVMQESEHPHFLVIYRFFLNRYRNLLKLEKRAQWAGLALIWVVTRVDKISEEEILYIAWEVAQLLQLQRTGDLKDARGLDEAPDMIVPRTEKSLRRRWGKVCAHFPQAWWRRQFVKKIRQQRHQFLRNSSRNGGNNKGNIDAVLIDEATLESVIHESESSTLPFARFLKHHARGLCTGLTSTRLFDDVTLAILRTGGPCDMMERNACYLLASKRDLWRLYQSN